MITYNWEINSLDCYKSINELQNVIFNVHWNYIGIDDATNIASSIHGVTLLPEPNINKFMDINNINKETIILWLISLLDVDSMNTEIDKKINEIINTNTFRIDF